MVNQLMKVSIIFLLLINFLEPSFGDKFKSYAYNFTMFAAEKAKDLKEKSSSVINKLHETYGK